MEANITELWNNMIQSFNWAQPSWDMFIILFFIIAALIYGVSLGRDRIIIIILSIYVSLAIVNYAPFLNEFTTTININESFAFQITTFLGVFILLFFLLSQSALLRTLGENATQGSWWQVIIFSVLQAGLLASVTLSFLPDESINTFTEFTKQFFVSETARSVWVVLPILAMAFLPGLRHKDR
ncbi:MAG: hypothetical protein ABIH67_01100 [Candidatus Uhrbacteria bacterium]